LKYSKRIIFKEAGTIDYEKETQMVTIKYHAILLLIILLIASCNKFNPAEEKLSLPKKYIPMHTQCSIETINDISIKQKQQTIEINSNQDVIITGWAIDVLNKGAAGGVIIDIDGKLYPSYYGGDRPDVADYYKNPEFRYSSFASTIPAIKIGPGKHTLSLKIITYDKTAFFNSDQSVMFEMK
jgi:hypothetical protein